MTNDIGGNAAERQATAIGEPEIERSITIGATCEALSRKWLDPDTLARIMAGFATVRDGSGGRTHWKIEGPLGSTFAWDSEIVDNRPGARVARRSVPGADVPNEGSVRFHPAPVGRGSVATLRFSFDPPGGVLGDAAVRFLGHRALDLAVDRVLRRFKSLVETGEILSIESQPAARDDTR